MSGPTACPRALRAWSTESQRRNAEAKSFMSPGKARRAPADTSRDGSLPVQPLLPATAATVMMEAMLQPDAGGEVRGARVQYSSLQAGNRSSRRRCACSAAGGTHAETG